MNVDWQPIETCPMHRYVLLWLDGFHYIGYQFEKDKFTEHHNRRRRHEIFHATHWTNLPAPPKIK